MVTAVPLAGCHARPGSDLAGAAGGLWVVRGRGRARSAGAWPMSAGASTTLSVPGQPSIGLVPPGRRKRWAGSRSARSDLRAAPARPAGFNARRSSATRSYRARGVQMDPCSRLLMRTSRDQARALARLTSSRGRKWTRTWFDAVALQAEAQGVEAQICSGPGTRLAPISPGLLGSPGAWRSTTFHPRPRPGLGRSGPQAPDYGACSAPAATSTRRSTRHRSGSPAAANRVSRARNVQRQPLADRRAVVMDGMHAGPWSCSGQRSRARSRCGRGAWGWGESLTGRAPCAGCGGVCGDVGGDAREAARRAPSRGKVAGAGERGEGSAGGRCPSVEPVGIGWLLGPRSSPDSTSPSPGRVVASTSPTAPRGCHA